MFFAAALMLSVATAWDDIENVLDQDPVANEEFWQPAEHDYEPPEHNAKYHEAFPPTSANNEGLATTEESHPDDKLTIKMDFKESATQKEEAH